MLDISITDNKNKVSINFSAEPGADEIEVTMKSLLPDYPVDEPLEIYITNVEFQRIAQALELRGDE